MAGSQGGQGTGKHPHKSSEEPYPHTKESGRSGDDRKERRSESQSSGRHHQASGGESQGRGESGGGQGRGSGSDDLKQREYRDEKGEVHHHTKTYMEQHKK